MPRYSRPPLAVVPSATVFAACAWVSRPLAALTAASACCLTAAASCLAVGTFAPFLTTLTDAFMPGWMSQKTV